MTQLKDRNGEPFTGTPAELKRHNNKLCKRAARAVADPTLVLPLPPGIAAALDRVCKAGGFEDPRELLSTLVLKLEAIWDAGDRHQFEYLTTMTVSVSGLEKFFHVLGAEPEEEEAGDCLTGSSPDPLDS